MLSLVDLKICGNTGLEADSYETFLQWIMARIGRLEGILYFVISVQNLYFVQIFGRRVFQHKNIVLNCFFLSFHSQLGAEFFLLFFVYVAGVERESHHERRAPWCRMGLRETPRQSLLEVSGIGKRLGRVPRRPSALPVSSRQLVAFFRFSYCNFELSFFIEVRSTLIISGLS